MAEFTLSAMARDDLKDIYRFTFVTFGERQAEVYTRDLHSRFGLLADFPGMGLPAKLGRLVCLKFPSGPHVIYYRETATGVHIGRILHGAQDPGRQRFDDQ